MAEHGDALGFTGCVASEHHSREDGYIPSPLALCAAIVARTTRIEAGTGVMLLPPVAADPRRRGQRADRHHLRRRGSPSAPDWGSSTRIRPLRRRAAAAVGRLRGASRSCAWPGRASRSRSRAAFPPPRRARHAGAHAPSQIWMGGMSDRADPPRRPARRRLADRPPARSGDDRTWTTVYRQAAADAGRPAAVHLMRDCWLGEDEESAVRTVGPLPRGRLALLLRARIVPTGRFNPDAEPWLREITSAEQLTFERLGGPRTVRDRRGVREQLGCGSRRSRRIASTSASVSPTAPHTRRSRT